MARLPPEILDATRQGTERRSRQLIPLLLAAAATLPALGLRATGGSPPTWFAAILFGLAVVGAAFLLAWGAEALPTETNQDSPELSRLLAKKDGGARALSRFAVVWPSRKQRARVTFDAREE